MSYLWNAATFHNKQVEIIPSSISTVIVTKEAGMFKSKLSNDKPFLAHSIRYKLDVNVAMIILEINYRYYGDWIIYGPGIGQVFIQPALFMSGESECNLIVTCNEVLLLSACIDGEMQRDLIIQKEGTNGTQKEG